MKFDYLTVVKKSHQRKDGRWLYECVCDCGKAVYRPMNQLKNKHLSSCGCKVAERNKKHGMKGTKVYSIWSGMKNRCVNENNKDYKRYSLVGMCGRWMSFELFLLDMGEPPTNSHSIDRIDNTKGYSKGNCRWATATEQQTNKSNSKVWIAEGVEYKSLSDVALFYGHEKPVVHRWFKGYVSRGKKYPPKSGFTFKEVY